MIRHLIGHITQKLPRPCNSYSRPDYNQSFKTPRRQQLRWLTRIIALQLTLALCVGPAIAGIIVTGTSGITTIGGNSITYIGTNGITATGADGLLAFGPNGITATGADGI